MACTAVQRILDMVDTVTPQEMSQLLQELELRLRRDFLLLLPPEIAIKILGYLEVEDLLCGLQVCRKWRQFITEATPVWKAAATKLHGLFPLLMRRGSPSGAQQEPSPFCPQARITWKQCTGLPVEMVAPQTVVIGSKMYVSVGDHQVFSYSLSEDIWSSLPDCPVKWYGIGHLRGRVVVLGGKRSDGTTTNKVYMFDERWKDSIIPPMPNPRLRPTVSSHHDSLIVTSSYHTDIFNQCQWYRACSLPYATYDMIPVIICNTVYAVGGYEESEGYCNRVACASIDMLLQKSVPPDQVPGDSDSVWRTLPNTPFKDPAGATIGGCLLALGGMDDDGDHKNSVFMYNPSTQCWENIAQTSFSITWPTVQTISPTKFIVMGSYEESDDHSISRDVWMASLEIVF